MRARGGPSPDAQLAVDVNWDADGPDQKNFNGEWVDIRNLGTTDVSLAGWWLRDSWLRFSAPEDPGLPLPVLRRRARRRLVRLYVGCGENSAAHPGRYFWCQKESVFENANGKRDVGDGGYLFDPRGNLRASMIYPCTFNCGSALAGKVAITVHPATPESISVGQRKRRDARPRRAPAQAPPHRPPLHLHLGLSVRRRLGARPGRDADHPPGRRA